MISPIDRRRTPFELKVNFQDQLRYTAFARGVQNWTDNTSNGADHNRHGAARLRRGGTKKG
jgi:hypothetical protein